MKNKKDGKAKEEKTRANSNPAAVVDEISKSSDLKAFLVTVRDKLADEQSPAVTAMSAMNYLLSRTDIYSLMDSENKEIARDIWLRLKQTGLQLRNPPLLFDQVDGEQQGR
jgi:hypothetical protein